MPCRFPSHKHDWPRSGTLSISKCESKCALCSSSKDYKPASALRKHVMTHIKNDKMPLTLDKSTGGRPRLQTTAIDPSSRDQPETHPPSPGSTLTSELVPVALDAQGDTIDTIDDAFRSIKNICRLLNHPTVSPRFSYIPDALRIVEAAVSFSKTFGPEKTLIRRGLDCLRTAMPENCIFQNFTTAFIFGQSNRTRYLGFCQALHDIVCNLRQPNFSTSMMILEAFYATWILSLIIRFRYTQEGVLYSSYDESTLKTIFLSFGTRNETLDDLCNDVYQNSLPESLEHTHIRDKEVASRLYRKRIFGPADSLPRVVRERSLGESIRLLIEDLESTDVR